MSVPNPPFCAGPPIENPQYFVGRRRELNQLVTFMTADQPTSVNVVGDKRMGKSSLLRYFVRTYGERLRNSGRKADEFLVVYLSLQEARCQREADFFRAVAESLSQRLTLTRSGLKLQFWQPEWNRMTFAQACKHCAEKGVLPVICLDGFKELLIYRGAENFDAGFYNILRSLTQASALMLVIASRESLRVYREQHKINSSFFNDARKVKLGELIPPAVQDLVRLPQSLNHQADAALTEADQALAAQWGEQHPYKLQLAAICLWEARRNGQGTAEARWQFDQQLREVALPGMHWRRLLRVIWDGPVWIGNSVQRVGLRLDTVAAWLMGLTFLLSLGLLVAGGLNREKLGQAVNKVQQCLAEGAGCLQEKEPDDSRP